MRKGRFQHIQEIASELAADLRRRWLDDPRIREAANHYHGGAEVLDWFLFQQRTVSECENDRLTFFRNNSASDRGNIWVPSPQAYLVRSFCINFFPELTRTQYKHFVTTTDFRFVIMNKLMANYPVQGFYLSHDLDKPWTEFELDAPLFIAPQVFYEAEISFRDDYHVPGFKLPKRTKVSVMLKVGMIRPVC